MAPLRYAAKFDPFLSLDCARVEGGDQILPSGNLGARTIADKRATTSVALRRALCLKQLEERDATKPV